MLNYTLLGKGIKGILKPLLALMALITLYFTIMVYMFNPELKTMLAEYALAMPGVFEAFGMSADSGTLIGHMQNYLYGFFMLIIPLILIIIITNKAMVQYVDKGAMAYLLAAPVTRTTIVVTQMKVVATGILVFATYTFVLGVAASHFFHPGELDIEKFVYLTLGNLALQYMIGGMCFLGSTIFNEAKHNIAFALGICMTEFVIQLVANAGEKFAWCKYLTYYTLFDSKGIIEGETTALINCFVMLGIGVILFGIAIVVFKKKDLPI